MAQEQAQCPTRCQAPLSRHILVMACPRCTLRLIRSQREAHMRIPQRRALHASPTHHRLGAAMFPGEWQNATYHYNKATTKTLPIAFRHTDDLLEAYTTQQKRRLLSDSSLYQTARRNAIAAQRRNQDRVFVSKSTVKDFGDRAVVTAYVFDGKEAAEQEEERKRKQRMGERAEGAQGKRGPQARRRLGGPGGGRTGGPGGARTGGPPRGGGARGPPPRTGGAGGPPRTGGARGPPRVSGPTATGFRSVAGLGAGASSRGPPR